MIPLFSEVVQRVCAAIDTGMYYLQRSLCIIVAVQWVYVPIDMSTIPSYPYRLCTAMQSYPH